MATDGFSTSWLGVDSAGGEYQIGDVHARSWIVFGTLSSQQESSPSGMSPLSQSTRARWQTQLLQRQLGIRTG